MTNTNTVLRRDLKQRQVACVTRLYVRLDSHGTPRTGPRRAWWMDLRTRVCNGIGISYEIPRSRMYAWNAAGVTYVAVAVFVAHLVGHLAVFLAAAGVMVAATAVVLVAIANAHQPQVRPAALPDEVIEEHRKVAAFLARQAGCVAGGGRMSGDPDLDALAVFAAGCLIATTVRPADRRKS